MKHFVKGSKEAKEYMARLRKMRGKGRKTNARRKKKISPDDPRWLHEGKKSLGPGARARIEFHVDRLHVGTPDAEIEREVREVGARSGAPSWYIEKSVKVALKRHEKNRQQYRQVMGGHFGHGGNPPMLVVGNRGKKPKKNPRKSALRKEGEAAGREAARVNFSTPEGAAEMTKALANDTLGEIAGEIRYHQAQFAGDVSYELSASKLEKWEQGFYEGFEAEAKQLLRGGNPPMLVIGNPGKSKGTPTRKKVLGALHQMLQFSVADVARIAESLGSPGYEAPAWFDMLRTEGLIQPTRPLSPGETEFSTNWTLSTQGLRYIGKGKRRNNPGGVSKKRLQEFLKLSPDDAKKLHSLIRKADTPKEVDAALEFANEKMGGFGVEATRGPGWMPYYMDIGLLHVNMGETYAATLMYDTANRKFLVGTWGGEIEYRGWNPSIMSDVVSGAAFGAGGLMAERALTNPQLSKKAQDFISKKIGKLVREGYPQDQAIAIAYSMARRKGYKVPAAPSNPCVIPTMKRKKGKRRGNPKELPAHIANDPKFKAALKQFRKRHGADPVEIREVSVPSGFPKFLVPYGQAPHAVYDAPPHSNKGKRIHHFGKKRGSKKTQPWLVTSPEGGAKFLAFVGGSFKAKPDWLYD